MAKRFLTPIALPSLSSDPFTTTAGALYFNSTDSTLKLYNGTAWVNVGGVSADEGLLDHTHDYDGRIYSVQYGTLVSENKFTADGGSSLTDSFAVTWDGGDASGS
jgi:hypothetical protein